MVHDSSKRLDDSHAHDGRLSVKELDEARKRMIVTINDVLYNQYCKKEHVKYLEITISKVRSKVNTSILDDLKISGNSSDPNAESTPATRKLIWGGNNRKC